jgi:hypothetical protein
MADKKKVDATRLAKENLKGHLEELAKRGEKSRVLKYVMRKGVVISLMLICAVGAFEFPFVCGLCEFFLLFIYFDILKSEIVDRVSWRMAACLEERKNSGER